MYGQMTAGSWIYIGTQGILQGTYETFAEAGAPAFRRQLRGTVTLTAGLGGMGGAQPLAVTMNDGVVHRDRGRPRARPAAARHRLRRPTDRRPRRSPGAGRAMRPRGGEAALDRAGRQRRRDRAGLGRRRRAVRSRDRPDLGPRRARRLRAGRDRADGRGRSCGPANRTSTSAARRDSMADHVRAMLAFQRAGAVVFDYGNNLRAQAFEAGVADAFDYPGFVPAFIRPQFCEGRGPFRWVALSGDPADILRTDEAVLDLFPDDAGLHRWIAMAHERVPFQGLPARICWLGYGERARAGPGIQRACAHRRGLCPDRHRPRPSRRRLGRLTQPRDGGDGRRLGCDRRLAAPERARQYGRRAPRGSRSTTAAASASAIRNTPGWSWSPTGRRSRPNDSSES